MEEYRREREKGREVLKRLRKWHERYSDKSVSEDDLLDMVRGSEFVVRMHNRGLSIPIVEVLKYLNIKDLAFLDVASEGVIVPNYVEGTRELARQIYWNNTKWGFENSEEWTRSNKAKGIGLDERVSCPLSMAHFRYLKSGSELLEEYEVLSTTLGQKEEWVSEATVLDLNDRVSMFNPNPHFPLAALIFSGGQLEIVAYGGRPREKIGPKLFSYWPSRKNYIKMMSWSPDGLHLLIIEAEEKITELTSRRQKFKLFRYLPAACVIREVDVVFDELLPNSTSTSTWISDVEFLGVHEIGSPPVPTVFKYRISQLDIEKIKFCKAYWSNTSLEETKVASGGLTATKTHLYILQECPIHRNKHHRIAQVDMTGMLVGYIPVPGQVLQFSVTPKSEVLFCYKQHRICQFLGNADYYSLKIERRGPEQMKEFNSCLFGEPWIQKNPNHPTSCYNKIFFFKFNEEEEYVYFLNPPEEVGHNVYSQSELNDSPMGLNYSGSDYLSIKRACEGRFFHVGKHYLLTQSYSTGECLKVNNNNSSNNNNNKRKKVRSLSRA